MRHRVKGKKLSRSIHQRQALFKSLIQSLIVNEQIKTTKAKAKVVKRLIDKLIVQAKKGSLSHRRQTLAFLANKPAVHKLFDDIALRVKTRTSGFTRLIAIGKRRGDNALMVKLELVDKPIAKSKKADTKDKPAKGKGKK